MARTKTCRKGVDTQKRVSLSRADTFASKTAAIGDDSADNSVGNVTGSNAVNVFLGIGIAWSIAAIYWESQGLIFEVSPGRQVHVEWAGRGGGIWFCNMFSENFTGGWAELQLPCCHAAQASMGNFKKKC